VFRNGILHLTDSDSTIFAIQCIKVLLSDAVKSVNDLCISSVTCNRLHIPSYLYDVQLCITAWLALNSVICFGELNSLVMLLRERVRCA